jgi:hypothetical protein
MNNPETLATLDTGRRQKQSKNKTLKHNTETKEVEQYEPNKKSQVNSDARCFATGSSTFWVLIFEKFNSIR